MDPRDDAAGFRERIARLHPPYAVSARTVGCFYDFDNHLFELPKAVSKRGRRAIRPPQA